MKLYIVILICILDSLFTFVFATRYAMEIKKRDEAKPEDALSKPMYKEWMVLAMGILLGSPGLLLSYVLPQIHQEDKYNGRRYLLISIGLFILHALVFFLLIYFKAVQIS